MPVKVALILALLAALGLTVSAQEPTTRNLEKEKPIWKQLQSIAPGAIEDFKAGTVAMDSNNYEEAIKRYESVRKKAPDFDPMLRRLGFSLAYAGRVDEGIELIEKALQQNRSPENLMGLARTLAYPNETKEGTEAQKVRALALAKEADRRPETQGDSDYKVTVAQIALDINQLDDFRNATQQLVAKHPDLMLTHYFNAILAATDENWITAENEIKTAESMGLSHDVAQRFLDAGVHRRAAVWHYLIYALCLVAVWVLGWHHSSWLVNSCREERCARSTPAIQTRRPPLRISHYESGTELLSTSLAFTTTSHSRW